MITHTRLEGKAQKSRPKAAGIIVKRLYQRNEAEACAGAVDCV